MKRLLILASTLWLVACGPKPDYSIVLWEQPSPKAAAEAHAKERPGLLMLPATGTSMLPMIDGAAGDHIVIDKTFPFEKLVAGDVATYGPDVQDLKYYSGLQAYQTITHMVAGKQGTGYIMDGINTKHYEKGALLMEKRNYIGKVIQIYTKRKKP